MNPQGRRSGAIARVIRPPAGARRGAAALGPTDLAMPGIVFQIGVEPNRIDVLTSIDGVTFRRPGRPQDLVDADLLAQEGPG